MAASITDRGFERLRELLTDPTQTHVDLRDNEFGDEGVQVVAQALQTNTTLTSLDLGSNYLGPPRVRVLVQALQTNTTLASLGLEHNELGDAGAQALAQALLTNTSLANLSLVRNQLGEAGAQALAQALQTNSTLSSLDLKENQLGNAGLQAFTQAMQANTGLTSLNLEYNGLDSAGAPFLARALQTNTTLTSLNLHENQLGDAGALALAAALQINSTLVDLNLADNQLSVAGAQALAQGLRTNTTLASLNLAHNGLGNAGVQAIADALQTNRTLTSLDLECTGLTADGAQAVARVLQTDSTLTILCLASNALGAAGARSLAWGLQTNNTLTTLRLGFTKLGEAGAETVVQFLRTNSCLTSLDLCSNQIGEAGAQALAQALPGNSTLRILNLSANKIGDVGVHALAQVLQNNSNTRLASLNLGRNKFGDAGVRALAQALQSNTTLVSLNLEKIGLDASHPAIEHINAALRRNNGPPSTPSRSPAGRPRPSPSPPRATPSIAYTTIPFSELSAATDSFSPAHLLSDDGAFGPVYRGIWRGTKIAVKVLGGGGGIDASHSDAARRAQFESELRHLSQARHKNLLPLIGASTDHLPKPCIVYALMSRGSLDKVISAARAGAAARVLPWRRRVAIFLDLCEALNFLHNTLSPALLHRDIKSANVLLDHHLSACLGDFGIARAVPEISAAAATHASTRILGTPGYIDPEYAQSGRVSAASDVYGVGIVLGELLTSWPAFDPASDPPALSARFQDLKEDGAGCESYLDNELGWDAAVADALIDVAHKCQSGRSRRRPTTAALLVQVQLLATANGCTPKALAEAAGGAAGSEGNEAASAAAAAGGAGLGQVAGDCVICFEPATHALVPCGHLCLCEEHTEAYSGDGVGGQSPTCPLCRERVSQVIKVFF